MTRKNNIVSLKEIKKKRRITIMKKRISSPDFSMGVSMVIIGIVALILLVYSEMMLLQNP
jgi:hypothetical protein